MLDFIPFNALAGGALLGLGAALLLIFNGKIAGISGIFNGATDRHNQQRGWQILFILGLVVGGLIAIYVFALDGPDTSSLNPIMVVIAGLIVGAGTRLGSGCTSGHGICGIGRLSKRSIVATCVFMLVAAITVYVRLHLL